MPRGEAATVKILTLVYQNPSSLREDLGEMVISSCNLIRIVEVVVGVQIKGDHA